MKFEFGSFVLDVDVEKTREIYKNLPTLTQGCNCQGCRNYVKALPSLPDDVLRFFDSLGVDPAKTPETFVMDASADLVWYIGWYHICGEILQGASTRDKMKYDSLTEHFHVGVCKECELLEKDFSSPVLQLEIDARIPWALDEPNTYL